LGHPARSRMVRASADRPGFTGAGPDAPGFLRSGPLSSASERERGALLRPLWVAGAVPGLDGLRATHRQGRLCLPKTDLLELRSLETRSRSDHLETRGSRDPGVVACQSSTRLRTVISK